MTYIRQLLNKKGTDVWSTAPDGSVYDALKLLADKGIGVLLVLQDGQLVGIISERDYARKVELHGKTAEETAVRDIMVEDVITVGPETAVEDAMALMTEKRIRHLPVVEGTEIAGLISIGDLVKSVIAEKEFTINQLQNYIRGA